MERKVIFHIFSNDKNFLIKLKEFDTVGDLKDAIFRETGITKSKQALIGWRQPPDDDYDILQKCAYNGIVNVLDLQEKNLINSKNSCFNDGLELKACANFIHEVINNISDISVLFNVQLLKNIIWELHMTPLEKRKVLLLYIHNKLDPFSNIFWRNMKKSNVKEILTKRFCVIGWDLSDKTLHNALIHALNTNELDHIVPYIKDNISAAFCLTDDGQKGVKIFSCMTKTISDADFFNCLLNASESGYEKEVINSIFVQQNFADSLGDRDYDSYEPDQHEYLKKKIGHAIAGAPTEVTGYNDELKKKIENFYKKIRSKSNEVARCKDKVEMAIIYNCIEPLPNVKKDRKEKNPKYKPDEDIMPLPVFIIRKCHGSINPCRIFIDHSERVYSTWKEYLTQNKLNECVMVYPKNGRYEFDQNEKVVLERDYSPAYGTAAKVLKGLDIAGAVGGVASGGVGVASTVLTGTAIAASSPILAAALPVAGIAAMATAPVVGIYSIVRSTMAIRDRRLREESMNFFKSSEARGAYMNIVAGSLGFIGAGTNVIFSKLVSNGVRIGTGAKVAVNAMNVFNLGAGGASMVNSIHDVMSEWVTNKEPPSALTLIQLSSNILFFGHAVVNFKTATTIIDETQAKVLQDYRDNLRNNKQRKIFNKILKQTVQKNDGNSVQAKREVIAALRNIPNKNESFAVLSSNLSKLNKKGIKVSAHNGQIVVNGVAIDIAEFYTMKGNEVNSFLTYLPANNDVNAEKVTSVRNIFNSVSRVNNINLASVPGLVIYAAKLISCCSGDVKERIISTAAQLLRRTADPYMKLLKEMLPDDWYFDVFNKVLNFFSRIAQEFENKYKKWKTSNSYEDYLSIFDDVDFDNIKGYIKFMEKAVNKCFEFKHMKPEVFKELINYCYQYIVKQYNDKNKEPFTSVKINCKVCGGHYFKSQI